MDATKLHALDVIVTYPAAEKPFQDRNAATTETVGALKALVLTAFGLVEGARPDGSSVTYPLYHDKVELQDMSRTLGELAGEHHELRLKLAQRITQGDTGIESTDVSVLNLAADLEAVKNVEDAERWELLKTGPREVSATMHSQRAPAELFQFVLRWVRYPECPPSIKCRDLKTGREDVTAAWPKLRGFRPTSFDTCVSYSAEGFKLHPEWATDPQFRWDPRGNVLLKVLRILVDELDNHFEGRHP